MDDEDINDDVDEDDSIVEREFEVFIIFVGFNSVGGDWMACCCWRVSDRGDNDDTNSEDLDEDEGEDVDEELLPLFVFSLLLLIQLFAEFIKFNFKSLKFCCFFSETEEAWRDVWFESFDDEDDDGDVVENSDDEDDAELSSDDDDDEWSDSFFNLFEREVVEVSTIKLEST